MKILTIPSTQDNGDTGLIIYVVVIIMRTGEHELEKEEAQG